MENLAKEMKVEEAHRNLSIDLPKSSRYYSQAIALNRLWRTLITIPQNILIRKELLKKLDSYFRSSSQTHYRKYYFTRRNWMNRRADINKKNAKLTQRKERSKQGSHSSQCEQDQPPHTPPHRIFSCGASLGASVSSWVQQQNSIEESNETINKTSSRKNREDHFPIHVKFIIKTVVLKTVFPKMIFL
ncbi:hypothetical protein RclHR1_00190003 [Rhizophagus clarus]|uniref:Uncharacterized protein n=1 Tax=Rhizophagus clarus TaxID=94130 RepID=A0A2Z6QNH1_9GLOM|nr:hypothetical protein RclHR1_00190003 [Rhizophagus clarus]